MEHKPQYIIIVIVPEPLTTKTSSQAAIQRFATTSFAVYWIRKQPR